MTPADSLNDNPDSTPTPAGRRVRPSADLRYAHNLPLQLSTFIGREHELEHLKPLLWSTRLLTLTGPGGCGKTRLALKVAEQLLDAWRDPSSRAGHLLRRLSIIFIPVSCCWCWIIANM